MSDPYSGQPASQPSPRADEPRIQRSQIVGTLSLVTHGYADGRVVLSLSVTGASTTHHLSAPQAWALFTQLTDVVAEFPDELLE